MKPILQSESSECGLACLAMIANHHKYHVDLNELRQRFSVSLKGATLGQIIRYAGAMQLASRPLRLDLDELSKLRLPCILHWDFNHFVVLEKITKDWKGEPQLVLLDPAVGRRRIPVLAASKHFTGVAVEFAKTRSFKSKNAPPPISLSNLTGDVIGLRTALLKIFCIALCLEAFVIAGPLFNQFVTDEVIVTGDGELLKVLIFGFALLLVTQTTLSLARSWILMRWSTDVGFQWTSRILAHMMKLPAAFFEKRHLGDILSKFGSASSIQSTLTTLFVESALDGIMAILALVMMYAYSAKLTLIVGGCVLLYALLRWGFYSPLREATMERLILAAKESSYFVETVRAINPVKLFGREAERHARWQNLRHDVINRDVQTQKLSILFRTGNSVISGAQGLAVMYYGASLVMANALSIGMMFAFFSYSSTFSGRIFRLIDAFIEFRMLSLHLERLSDIVLQELEEELELETDLTRIRPSIEVRDVRFRYAEGEPWVLDELNFTIQAGQSVALVGPSGCGKTTLCKLLLGLLEPTEGEILIDNVPIKRIGLRAYRELIGTVMQDDVLLAGSIEDNIAFFDTKKDRDWIRACAALAAIDVEISAMPMGYQTLVGDMGSSLSGGQKQRILLARALYKRPKILALDEATSHLDVQNEKSVNEAVAGLGLTRIIVAHRPETIRSAERVILLENGKVIDELKTHGEEKSDRSSSKTSREAACR